MWRQFTPYTYGEQASKLLHGHSMYTVSHKKGDTKLMEVTSSNLSRFSQIFYCPIL